MRSTLAPSRPQASCRTLRATAANATVCRSASAVAVSSTSPAAMMMTTTVTMNKKKHASFPVNARRQRFQQRPRRSAVIAAAIAASSSSDQQQQQQTPTQAIYSRLQNGSDIRGVAIAGVEGQPLTLSPAVAFFIGKGLVEYLLRRRRSKKEENSSSSSEPFPRIAVGRDPRLSGPMLEGAISAGVAAAGGHVARCGLATTPAMFLACVAEGHEYDAGVMITASHLPFNRNGFKFFTREGGFEKADIKELLALAAEAHAEAASEVQGEGGEGGKLPGAKVLTADARSLAVVAPGTDPASTLSSSTSPTSTTNIDPSSFPPPDGTGYVLEAALSADRHAVAAVDFMPVYEAHLRRIIVEGVDARGPKRERPLEGLRIVVDAGNGSGGFLATRVFAPLGADVSGSQFLEPDGTFPNHPPNPEDKAAMRAAVAMVRSARADLGVVVDTDVDRSAVVGASGEPINSNRYIALMSHIVLTKYPGTCIVTDSVTSDGLAEFIEARGGKHVRYKRGYRNVINKCIEINNSDSGERCELAMETSGHGAMAENYFLDDGTYSASQIVIMLARAVLAEEENKEKGGGGNEEAATSSAAAKEEEASKGPRGRHQSNQRRSAARDVALSVLASLREPADSVEIRMQVLGAAQADIQATSAAALAAFRAWVVGGGAGGSWSLEEVNHEGWRARVDESGEPGGGRGWVLLRGSLHDPLLVLNAESSVANGTCAIVEKVLEFFETAAPKGCVDIDKLYDSASPCTLRL